MRKNFRSIFAALFTMLAAASQGFGADLIYVNDSRKIVTYDVSKNTDTDVLNSKTTFVNTDISTGGPLSFDASGNLYAGNQDYSNSFINKYNSTGGFQQKIGSSSNLRGEAAIAINSVNNIYVSNSWTSGITIFNNASVYSGNYAVSSSSGIVFDKSDNLYMFYGAAIRKYNPSGNVDATFTLYNATWRGLTIDQAGNLFATDYSNNHIVKLDTSGNITGTFGNSTNLTAPTYVTVDAIGNIYASGQGSYISKFNSAGVFNINGRERQVAWPSPLHPFQSPPPTPWPRLVRRFWLSWPGGGSGAGLEITKRPSLVNISTIQPDHHPEVGVGLVTAAPLLPGVFTNGRDIGCISSFLIMDVFDFGQS